MGKPLLIIVNGLPGSGKTTLAQRLGTDTKLPVFSRDGIYEKLYDALDCTSNGIPSLLGSASFSFLYFVTGKVLATGQSAIVEAFFGRPDLRTAELLDLQRTHDFEPFQILCKADGNVLLERFQARMKSEFRHQSHDDQAWIETNKEMLLRGQLAHLSLDGQSIEINTNNSHSVDYEVLLQLVRRQITQDKD
jgi:predicted kinase